MISFQFSFCSDDVLGKIHLPVPKYALSWNFLLYTLLAHGTIKADILTRRNEIYAKALFSLIFRWWWSYQVLEVGIGDLLPSSSDEADRSRVKSFLPPSLSPSKGLLLLLLLLSHFHITLASFFRHSIAYSSFSFLELFAVLQFPWRTCF